VTAGTAVACSVTVARYQRVVGDTVSITAKRGGEKRGET
jgi:hypothetical protein